MSSSKKNNVPVSITLLMSIYKNDNPSFLKQAIESVVTQTGYLDQVVVVCDGAVGQELDRLIEGFRLKLIEQNVLFENPRLSENMGLGRALQFGINFCTSDYIVRMDSDDICVDGRFKSVKNAITDHPEMDVIGGQIEEFFDQPGDLGLFRTMPLKCDDIASLAKIRNPMNHVTVCIKKSSLEAVGGYSHMLWHEDYYLWLKMLAQDYKLMNLDSVHVLVRTDGFGSRRSGFKYINAELSFVRAARSLGVFTLFDALRYMLPRLVIRILPVRLVSIIYKLLRSKK